MTLGKRYLEKGKIVFSEKGVSGLARASVMQFFRRSHPRWLRAYSHAHYLLNHVRFDAPAKPFSSIEIKAKEITEADSVSKNLGLGRVVGGDWDRQCNRQPVSELAVIRGLEQRFGEGVPWEETAYVAQARERFESGERIAECENIDEFMQKRCANLDGLYKSIRDDGYRYREERADDASEGKHSHNLDPIVSISREGDILFSGSGYHRFAISRALDLKIPFQVTVRHRRWQECRDLIHRNGDALGDVQDHPDIHDLINSPRSNREDTEV